MERIQYIGSPQRVEPEQQMMREYHEFGRGCLIPALAILAFIGLVLVATIYGITVLMASI